jgi:hypothetical protein
VLKLPSIVSWVNPPGFVIVNIIDASLITAEVQDIVFPLIVTPQFAQLDNTGFPVFVVNV